MRPGRSLSGNRNSPEGVGQLAAVDVEQFHADFILTTISPSLGLTYSFIGI
jgi:hypothetical protein